jgi:YggT family protein
MRLPGIPMPFQAGLAAPRGSVYICPRNRETCRMTAVFVTLHVAISIYWWIIIASAVFSWLYAFNVVNSRNQFVAMIGEFLFKITEPALRPIRRFMPDLGGIDISPIVLLLGLTFLEVFMHTSIEPLFGVRHF